MIINDDDLVEFLKSIYNIYGHDFIHYNQKTVKRRIENHCIYLNIDKFDKYCKIVLNNKDHFDKMFKYLSINVTEFFREAEHLKLFREKVVPYLNSFSHIKIWCAGCSSGESPYSMSIILEEEGILDKCQIYATDFNNRILSYAKNGLFEIDDLEQTELNYQKSGGTKKFQNYFLKKGKYFKIKKRLKKHILFFNHNLAIDGVMNEFQLIVCKNVIIYFDDKLKERVFNLFYDSLEYNGFLILGKNENLSKKFDDKFQLYIPQSKVYHKK